MADRNGYIGRAPGDSAVIIASQTFEPTGIQTDFTFAAGYTVGHLDVYFNGARLIYANDYTAANGTTVGLTTYANNGDVIECVAYKAFNVADVTGAKNNFTVGSAITMTGDTGTISATTFSGDGSGLSGVGTADVSTSDLFVVGVSTLTGLTTTGTHVYVGGGLNVSGVSTLSGNLQIGSGVTIGPAGVATFSGTSDVHLYDGVILKLGNDTDAQITHTGVYGSINNSTGNFVNDISGNWFVRNQAGSENRIVAENDGSVELYEDGTKRFETTGYGVTISGGACISGVTTALGGLVVSGVSTLSGTVAIPDSTSLTMGDDDDLELFHAAGGNTYIKNNTGELEIRSNTTKIFNKSTSQTIAGFTQGASVGITTVGILTAYDSITVKVGAGSTELTTALNTKASTGKAIAMAMVFGF